jgi:hypothetical protein
MAFPAGSGEILVAVPAPGGIVPPWQPGLMFWPAPCWGYASLIVSGDQHLLGRARHIEASGSSRLSTPMA